MSSIMTGIESDVEQVLNQILENITLDCVTEEDHGSKVSCDALPSFISEPPHSPTLDDACNDNAIQGTVKFSFPQGSPEEDDDLFLAQTAFFAKEELSPLACDNETPGRTVDDSDSNYSSTTTSESESQTEDSEEMDENAAGDFAQAIVETRDPYNVGEEKILTPMALAAQWFANDIKPIRPSNFPEVGIKIGLSRKIRVAKPLHPNAVRQCEETEDFRDQKWKSKKMKCNYED